MEIPTQIFCVLIFENFSRASTVRIFLLKVEDLNYVLRFEHYIFHSDLSDNVYGQESPYKLYILLPESVTDPASEVFQTLQYL